MFMFAVYQVYLSLIEALHLIQSTVALTFIQSMIQTEMCSSHSVLSRNFCIKAHGYLYISGGGGGEGLKPDMGKVQKEKTQSG